MAFFSIAYYSVWIRIFRLVVCFGLGAAALLRLKKCFDLTTYTQTMQLQLEFSRLDLFGTTGSVAPILYQKPSQSVTILMYCSSRLLLLWSTFARLVSVRHGSVGSPFETCDLRSWQQKQFLFNRSINNAWVGLKSWNTLDWKRRFCGSYFKYMLSLQWCQNQVSRFSISNLEILN